MNATVIHAGGGEGSVWRKKNDKVIAYDVKRIDRGGGSEGLPYNRTTAPQQVQHTGEPRFANRDKSGYKESTVIETRQESSPSMVVANGNWGGNPSSTAASPELIEKILGLLRDVGNDDFDASDLKEMDQMAKRTDIIKKGIANLKQETRKVDDVQREKQLLKSDMNKEIEALKQEREMLKKQIEEKNSKISDLERDLKARDRETGVDRVTSEYTRKIEVLEKDLNSSKEANKSKDQEIEQKNKEITELKRQNTDLSGSTQDVSRKQREMEKRVEDLEREKKELEAKDADHKKHDAEKNKQLEDLRKEIEALKKKIAELEEEKKRLLTKSEEQEIAHKKQVNSLNEQIEKLEKELKEYKDRMSKIEKSNAEKDGILGKLASQIMELNRTRSQIDDK